MGHSHSKEIRRDSNSSQAPLKPEIDAENMYDTYYGATNPNFASGPAQASSTITRPAPRGHHHHLSELIDPYDVLGIGQDDIESMSDLYYQPGNVYRNKLPQLIESPSGQTLGPQEFLAHPNRPPAIRERQESIRKAVEEAKRKASLASQENNSAGHERKGSTGSIGSTGTARAFEEKRIEEGRLAYEAKLRAREERAESRGHGCFGCFGHRD